MSKVHPLNAPALEVVQELAEVIEPPPLIEKRTEESTVNPEPVALTCVPAGPNDG